MTTIPDVTFQTEPALAERRPVSHRACIEGMLAHADLTFTARVATRLVGVSRSVTDFHYCCYLSDLAVDAQYQRQGIGAGCRRLLSEGRVRTSSPSVDHSAIRREGALNSCSGLKIDDQVRNMKSAAHRG